MEWPLYKNSTYTQTITVQPRRETTELKYDKGPQNAKKRGKQEIISQSISIKTREHQIKLADNRFKAKKIPYVANV